MTADETTRQVTDNEPSSLAWVIGPPIEVASSATDFPTADELVAASDLIVVATVTEIADGRQITAPADPEAAVSHD